LINEPSMRRSSPRVAENHLRQHRVGDAERAQRLHGVRCQAQAEPELAGRRGALEHTDVPAGLPQRNRGRQPADAGADDESVRANLLTHHRNVALHNRRINWVAFPVASGTNRTEPPSA
jgi:hypothetical protein